MGGRLTTYFLGMLRLRTLDDRTRCLRLSTQASAGGSVTDLHQHGALHKHRRTLTLRLWDLTPTFRQWRNGRSQMASEVYGEEQAWRRRNDGPTLSSLAVHCRPCNRAVQYQFARPAMYSS